MRCPCLVRAGGRGTEFGETGNVGCWILSLVLGGDIRVCANLDRPSIGCCCDVLPVLTLLRCALGGIAGTAGAEHE